MQLLETWNRLSVLERAILTFVTVIIVCGAIFASWWALRDDYEILFSKLEPVDVATVTQRLDSDRVPYRLEDGGRTVTVPSGNSFKIRAKLLEQGITPAGGLGFELFDKAELGLTDFAQQVNYQRALQGELSRTIGALEGVEAARVHLVIPERRLFDVDSNQAKASVTLNLKEGVPFPNDRVDGIRRLVASAVPRLLAEHVDVHDSAGVELRGAQTELDASSLSSRLKQKQEFEAYLEQKSQKALDAMLGPGMALVKLDVSLNLNKVDTLKEQPLSAVGSGNGMVVRSKATTTAQRNKKPKFALQMADALDSENPSTGNSSDTSDRAFSQLAAPDDKSTQTETLYQVGRLSERMNIAPGSITRITGSVLVPHTLSPASHESVRYLVSGIVGLEESRGDVLNVLSKVLPAPASLAEESPAAEDGLAGVTSRPADKSTIWSILALIGGLLVLLALFVYRLRNSPKRLSDAERKDQLESIRRWLGEEVPS